MPFQGKHALLHSYRNSQRLIASELSRLFKKYQIFKIPNLFLSVRNFEKNDSYNKLWGWGGGVIPVLDVCERIVQCPLYHTDTAQTDDKVRDGVCLLVDRHIMRCTYLLG